MSKAAAVLEVHALSTLLAIYATKALHRARTQESTSHDMDVAHLIACQLQEVIEFIPRRVTRTFCIRGWSPSASSKFIQKSQNNLHTPKYVT